MMQKYYLWKQGAILNENVQNLVWNRLLVVDIMNLFHLATPKYATFPFVIVISNDHRSHLDNGCADLSYDDSGL